MGRGLAGVSTVPCTQQASGYWMTYVKKTLGLVNFQVHQVLFSKQLNLPGKCVRCLLAKPPP